MMGPMLDGDNLLSQSRCTILYCRDYTQVPRDTACSKVGVQRLCLYSGWTGTLGQGDRAGACFAPVHLKMLLSWRALECVHHKTVRRVGCARYIRIWGNVSLSLCCTTFPSLVPRKINCKMQLIFLGTGEGKNKSWQPYLFAPITSSTPRNTAR